MRGSSNNSPPSLQSAPDPRCKSKTDRDHVSYSSNPYSGTVGIPGMSLVGLAKQVTGCLEGGSPGDPPQLDMSAHFWLYNADVLPWFVTDVELYNDQDNHFLEQQKPFIICSMLVIAILPISRVFHSCSCM